MSDSIGAVPMAARTFAGHDARSRMRASHESAGAVGRGLGRRRAPCVLLDGGTLTERLGGSRRSWSTSRSASLQPSRPPARCARAAEAASSGFDAAAGVTVVAGVAARVYAIVNADEAGSGRPPRSGRAARRPAC